MEEKKILWTKIEFNVNIRDQKKDFGESSV